MEIDQKRSMPDYQKLKSMVKRSIDQKLRLRNFDARNERIETGTVVTSRRGQKGVETDKENAINGKQKESVREETSEVSSTMKIKRAKTTPRTALPSDSPTQRGRSASRKKSLRGWSPCGKTS